MSESCRSATLPSGETIRVRGSRPMTAEEAAALGVIVDAARAKYAAEHPPNPAAEALWARVTARCDALDLSLRGVAFQTGVRFSTLFRIGQGYMPGDEDLAAIDAWLTARENTAAGK